MQVNYTRYRTVTRLRLIKRAGAVLVSLLLQSVLYLGMLQDSELPENKISGR